MFRLNWIKLWPRPQRSPDATAVDTRVIASVLAPVAVPARERPAALLSTLALAGNEYFSEEDVDRATLGDLLSRTFMRVSYDEDGHLWAQDHAAPKGMQTLAARTNDAFMMVRFRAVVPQLFLAEYFLSYEKGLLAAQLVHSLKLFGRITQSAIREHGEDVLQ
jgi:hypothetical protein